MTKIDVLDKGYVRLIDKMGDDLSVVNAARVSYDKESAQFTAKDARLLAFLAREEHSSPLRHAVVSFEVYAPLMVARQWYKHAVASSHIESQFGWNESSRRYVTEEPEFYIPETWRGKPSNSKQGSSGAIPYNDSLITYSALVQYVELGVELYNAAIEKGVAVEQARLFLPANGMYVRWRWTASLAAVIHMLNLRMAHDAQKEIQDYAMAIKEHLTNLFPETCREFLDA